jgi:UDP-glucose 4-epimerase
MRVVVTGGAGFIGSHVVDALIDRGDAVTVIDDLSGGRRQHVNPAALFRKLDVRHPDAAALVREQAPDAIVHHAAQMSVGRSVREPLFDADVNVSGSLRLLEAARDTNSRFLFASSGGALYGDTDVLPTPEGHPTWPISPYGVSKLAFEHYLHCYGIEHRLPYVVLRYANVYGPRQSAEGEAGVVAAFCVRLLAGRQPVINGDGLQTRDYVHVQDVVSANLIALDHGESGHFNVGTGRQTNVVELFWTLTGVLGTEGAEVHGPARPGEQRRSALDCRLIGDALGWKARVDLQAGLADTAAWFRNHVPINAPSRG